MNKKEIKRILMNMRTPENEEAVNHLLGLIDMMNETDIQNKLEQLNANERNIAEILKGMIKKIQVQNEKSEHFTNVNKMFYYGRTENTIHMHLIPKDLRNVKNKLGDEAFYQFYKDQLEDFLSRLQDIFRKDTSIESLFAVSPIFFHPNISLAHVDLGFDNPIEIDLENKEDKMSIQQKEYFLNMFNPDSNHRRRVYYTSIAREKLLGKNYTRIPENAKTMLD